VVQVGVCACCYTHIEMWRQVVQVEVDVEVEVEGGKKQKPNETTSVASRQ